MRTSYERLTADHDAIDALCSDLLDLVGQHPLAPGTVRATLDRMTVVVADHIEREGNLVEQAAIAERFNGSRSATGLQQEFVALHAAWTGYLSYWTLEAIRAEPESFRAATVEIMGSMQGRVRRESEILYVPALRERLLVLRD